MQFKATVTLAVVVLTAVIASSSAIHWPFGWNEEEQTWDDDDDDVRNVTSQCHVAGECKNSVFLQYLYTSDVNICLQQCKDYTSDSKSCNWISMSYDINRCGLYADCVDLVYSPDSDTESSEVQCPLLFCSLSGVCQGRMNSYYKGVPTIQDCIAQCKLSSNCLWGVSYNADDKVCLFFDDCDSLSQTEDTITTTSAQRECRVP